jgi:hypothetical protein
LKPRVSDVVKTTAGNYVLLWFCTKTAGSGTYFIAAGYRYNLNAFSVIFVIFRVQAQRFWNFFLYFREYVRCINIFITIFYVQVQNLYVCSVRLHTLSDWEH